MLLVSSRQYRRRHSRKGGQVKRYACVGGYLVDAPAGEFVRFDDVQDERDAARAQVAELRAAVERLRRERTQDAGVRREQCEALDAAERATFAAIDRHQIAHARAATANAQVAELRAALALIVEMVGGDERKPTSVLVSIGREARAVLAKNPEAP